MDTGMGRILRRHPNRRRGSSRSGPDAHAATLEPHRPRPTPCLRIRTVLLSIWTSVCWIPAANAQGYGRLEQTETDLAYHYFVRAGEPTIQVQVLGTLGETGLYEVTEGTDLGQLIALAGGPPTGVRQARSRRTATIRLFRPGSGNHLPVYEAELEHGILNSHAYPSLADGDVLLVEVVEREGLRWRDGLVVLNSVMLLVLTVARVL